MSVEHWIEKQWVSAHSKEQRDTGAERLLCKRYPSELSGLQVDRQRLPLYLCQRGGLVVRVNAILMFHISSHARFVKGIWHALPFSWINWADLITNEVTRRIQPTLETITVSGIRAFMFYLFIYLCIIVHFLYGQYNFFGIFVQIVYMHFMYYEWIQECLLKSGEF